MKTFMKFFNSHILTLLVLLPASFAGVSFSQGQNKPDQIVKNVNYTTSNGNIIITYDLKGSKDMLYNVKVLLRRANYANFRYLPQTLSGDVGEGYFAGSGRKIIWQIKKDFPSGLPGEDYYFEVLVKEIDSSSNIFTWLGVGVAAAAAVVTYIFISGNSSSDDNNGGTTTLPPPPGRP